MWSPNLFLFSAIESSGAENDELRELIGHHRIMADSLSTLRFYRHAGKSKASSRMFNKLAKPLLDLSRLDWESDLGTQFANPVSKNFCFFVFRSVLVVALSQTRNASSPSPALTWISLPYFLRAAQSHSGVRDQICQI